jgi:hypothetical protein
VSTAKTAELQLADGRVNRVDAGLAEHLQRINQAGYKSVQSCSGLGADHPDRKQAHGYIAWYRADLGAAQESAIIQAAVAAGLEDRYGDLFFLPSLAVRVSLLADGTREKSIREEANKLACSALGYTSTPYGDDFMPWLAYRERAMAGLAQAHGGLALQNDEQITAAWQTFTALLLQA